MSGIVHYRLPFAASSTALVLETLERHFSRDIYRSAIHYLTDSDARARAVHSMAVKRRGALPAGFFGTIDGFARHLGREAGFDVPGALTADMLLARAMRARTGREPLRGAIDQMRQALRRVRVALPENERDHQLMVIETKADPALARRLKLVRETLSTLHESLHKEGLVDEAELEWRLAPLCRELFSSTALVIVDDIYRLGPSQERFIEAVLRAAPVAVMITRSSDPASDVELAARPAHALFERVCKPVAWDVAMGQTELVEAYVQGLPTPHSVLRTPHCSIAPTERDEVNAAIERIKRLHIEQNVPLDDIAVCFVTLEQQRRALPLFELAAVPAAPAKGESLRRSPAVASLLALVDACVHGLEREKTLVALRSPFLTGLAKLCGNERQTWDRFLDELTNAARTARVIAGVPSQSLETGWLEPLGKAAQANEIGEPVIKAAEPLLQRLAELGCAATMGGFLARIGKLADDAEMAKRVALLAQQELRTSSDSALRTPRSTLLQSGFEHFAELFAQLEGIHRRYGEGGARDARSLFFDLCNVLDATSINRGHCPGHVRLLGIADARSLDVPHLFVCGLVDGELPFPDPENIYLPHRIATYAGNLRDEQVLALTRDVEPASLYLHLFASLLGKEHLYLSRAKHVDDAERAPSLPLARLERCIGDSTEISGTNAPISQRDVQRMLADKPAMTGRGKDAMRPEWFAPALAGMAATLERDHAELVESPFEGHLGDAGRTVMAERYKETPLYSPSAIETYAACPLKYFFKYGLGVDEPNLPEADVSPMEKGTLLHAVLEQAFLKIREILQDDGGSIHVEANGTKLPLLSLERFEVLSKKPALALLRETFEVCARDCRITAASWRRWVGRTLASLSEGAALRSELSNFLACERKHQGLGLFPWLLEYELGRKEESDAKPLEFKLNDGSKISLRGSIDRVDVLVAGNEPRFVVVRDYKSGRSSLNAGIKSGTRFQLPVYQKFALAAAGGLAAGGFFYHKLADITEFAVDGAYVVPEVKTALAGEDNRKQWKQPDELLNEHLPARLSALFAAMKAGRFHPTLVDGEKSCAYCGYRGACQVRHEKQRRLHQRGAELRDQLGVYFPEAL